MGRKIRHWKHGWIPLDAAALAEARRRGVDVSPAQAKAAGGKDAAKKADADWLARERARIAGNAPAAKALDKAPTRAPAKAASKVTGGPSIDKAKSAAINARVEDYYSDFAYLKAIDGLDVSASDSELDDFLTSIADFRRGSEDAKPALAKRLLDHADRLGVRLPKDVEDGLKAYRR